MFTDILYLCAYVQLRSDSDYNKEATYLTTVIIFQPLAFETHGATHDSAQQFLYTLDSRVSEASGAARESSFLWQRLSVLIQRFNATLISETFLYFSFCFTPKFF